MSIENIGANVTSINNLKYTASRNATGLWANIRDLADKTRDIGKTIESNWKIIEDKLKSNNADIKEIQKEIKQFREILSTYHNSPVFEDSFDFFGKHKTNGEQVRKLITELLELEKILNESKFLSFPITSKNNIKIFSQMIKTKTSVDLFLRIYINNKIKWYDSIKNKIEKQSKKITG